MRIGRRTSGIQRPHEGFAATSSFGQWILSRQRFGRSLRGRDYNVLPGQMGYSSTLSDRRDVTRVDCRIEDVVYLVPLMDAERCALTCV